MSITNVNPRSIGIEGEYFGANMAALADLRQRAIDAGNSASVADGLVGWITGKAAGHEDQSSPGTRSRYRRILRDLAGDGGPKKGRRVAADNPRGVRYVGQRVGRRERRSAVMAQAA